MKILANDGIAPAGKEKLEANGFTVDTEKIDQEKLIDAINDNKYVAVLVRSATTVRKDLIDACPGLKLIGRGGVGMDNIDVEYARSKGIHVVNTPAASSQSVAELVIGQMFSISRSTFDAAKEMPVNGATEFKKLKKKYAKGVELRGKTLGIIGLGRIGQATASYALGMGMDVVGHDPFVDEANIKVTVGKEEVGIAVKSVALDQLLVESDYISLHVPKQEDGSAVIGKGEISKMKKGVRLVNAARGGVIDEDALIEGLDSGAIAAAALDVYENEPTPREDLLQHGRIAVTPHIGAATVEAQERIGLELADQILELLGVPA